MRSRILCHIAVAISALLLAYYELAVEHDLLTNHPVTISMLLFLMVGAWLSATLK